MITGRQASGVLSSHPTMVGMPRPIASQSDAPAASGPSVTVDSEAVQPAPAGAAPRATLELDVVNDPDVVSVPASVEQRLRQSLPLPPQMTPLVGVPVELPQISAHDFAQRRRDAEHARLDPSTAPARKFEIPDVPPPVPTPRGPGGALTWAIVGVLSLGGALLAYRLARKPVSAPPAVTATPSAGEAGDQPPPPIRAPLPTPAVAPQVSATPLPRPVVPAALPAQVVAAPASAAAPAPKPASTVAARPAPAPDVAPKPAPAQAPKPAPAAAPKPAAPLPVAAAKPAPPPPAAKPASPAPAKPTAQPAPAVAPKPVAAKPAAAAAGGDATQAYQEGTKAFLSGDLAAARASFERAIKLDPGHAASYKNLGTVYQKLGETAKAKKSYEKYLQIAPAAKDADLIRKRIAEL